MSKSHRDNHNARKKRGSVAFKKKAKRRHPNRKKCNLCGTAARPKVMIGGLCPRCMGLGIGIPMGVINHGVLE